MYKRFSLFILLILFTGVYASACSCRSLSLTENYGRAEFIALAKIISIKPDPLEKENHNAEIEVIKLYKGKAKKKIKIFSMANTSCYFLPSANSTWLIFASTWNKQIGFGLCSGSLQLDKIPELSLDRNLGKYMKRSNDIALNALEYLSKHDILKGYPNGLNAQCNELRTVRGYQNKNRFAVFKVTLNPDLSIESIDAVKKFDNGFLNAAVVRTLRRKLYFILDRGKLKKPTSVHLLCYFYPKVTAAEPSFVSMHDE